MKFCDKCGSYMKETEGGFVCRKCGKRIQANAKIRGIKKIERSTSLHIVDSSEDEYVKVSQVCPKCGNEEAFRWFSQVSGEHAGIRRERTVEHFKCARCLHSWSKIS